MHEVLLFPNSKVDFIINFRNMYEIKIPLCNVNQIKQIQRFILFKQRYQTKFFEFHRYVC